MSIILLPFAMLPIFIALERIPRSIVDASADLGACAFQTFRDVVWPLSMQGTIVGATFTFVLALGDFITPQMVGGTSGFTFGRIIYSQFGFAFNWPFGAALSVILLVVVLIAIVGTEPAHPQRGTSCDPPVGHAHWSSSALIAGFVLLVLYGPLFVADLLLVLQVREQRRPVGQLLLRRLLVAGPRREHHRRGARTRCWSAASRSASRWSSARRSPSTTTAAGRGSARCCSS